MHRESYESFNSLTKSVMNILSPNRNEDHYDDGDFCGGCHNEGVDYGGAYRDVYYARLSLNGVKWHEYEEVVSDMLELCDKLQDPDNPQAYAYKIMLDDMLGKVDVKCNANNEESSIYNAPYLKEFVNDDIPWVQVIVAGGILFKFSDLWKICLIEPRHICRHQAREVVTFSRSREALMQTFNISN